MSPVRLFARAVATLAIVGSVSVACSGDSFGPDPTGEASVRLTQDGGLAASVSPDALLASFAASALPPEIPAEAIEAIEAIEVTLVGIRVHRTNRSLNESDDDSTEECDEASAESGCDDDTEECDEASADSGCHDETDGPKAGWISLSLDTAAPTNLLDLPSASGAQVANGQLPAGWYNNVRLLYENAVIRLSQDVQLNGQTIVAGEYPLFIPSGEQKGIQIKTSFWIDGGDTETVTIEFSTLTSISSVKWLGNGFKFKPHLKQR